MEREWTHRLPGHFDEEMGIIQVGPGLKAETFRLSRTWGDATILVRQYGYCNTEKAYAGDPLGGVPGACANTEYNEATQGTSVAPRRKRRLANCPRLVHKIESHGS